MRKCAYCDFECEREDYFKHLNESHAKCGTCFKVVFDTDEFDDELLICGECRLKENFGLEDEEVVEVDSVKYKYDQFYKHLSRVTSKGDLNPPMIMCPKCHATTFQISYGDYSCLANCECGHVTEVYGG